MSTLVAALLLGARLGPVFAVPPPFGAGRVPLAIRLAMMLALVGLLLPIAPRAPLAPLVLVALFGKELLIGLALAFAVAMVFYGAEAGGRLIDLARAGFPSGAGPFSQLYELTAIVLFVSLGGYRLLLATVAHSYEVLPLASFPRANGILAMVELAVATSGQVLVIALGIAAPVVVALLLGDLAIAIVARATSSIPVQLAAAPARPLLAIATALAALAVTLPWLDATLRRALDVLAQTVQRLTP